MKKMILLLILLNSSILIQAQVDTTNYCINNNCYTELKITPGIHNFAVQMDGQELKNNSEKIEVDARAGKNYYLTASRVAGGLWSKTYFNELPENRALKRLTKLKRIISVK